MKSVDNSARVVALVAAKVRKGVIACGLAIETDAKRLAPVLTGNHRRSIHTEMIEDPDQITARITHYSDYGIWLELGTSKMAARPHFRPALEMNKDVARFISNA